MNRVPMLDKSCCGCTLKNGSVMIGAANIMYGICVLLDELLVFRYVEYKYFWLFDWQIMPFVQMVLALLIITVNVILLFGVNKEKQGLVFAWLIVTASIMAVNIVVIPVTIYFGFAYELPPWDIAILFCGFIEIALQIYYLLVVYSYYRIIDERGPSNII